MPADPTPPEPIDTAALREALAKATCEPWRLVTNEHGCHEIRGEPYEFAPDGYLVTVMDDDHPGAMNARLIVAAVNALPALLSRLERLEAVQQAAREAADAEEAERALEIDFGRDGEESILESLKAAYADVKTAKGRVRAALSALDAPAAAQEAKP